MNELEWEEEEEEEEAFSIFVEDTWFNSSAFAMVSLKIDDAIEQNLL